MLIRKKFTFIGVILYLVLIAIFKRLIVILFMNYSSYAFYLRINYLYVSGYNAGKFVLIAITF